LGGLTRESEEKGRDIAIAVVNNLSEDQLPIELKESNAFHPPAYISFTLNIP
jgi:hypothetical protein